LLKYFEFGLNTIFHYFLSAVSPQHPNRIT